ncbi:hypothetical protein C463_00430, partial [Halorubrum californiense DSM 19288]
MCDQRIEIRFRLLTHVPVYNIVKPLADREDIRTRWRGLSKHSSINKVVQYRPWLVLNVGIKRIQQLGSLDTFFLGIYPCSVERLCDGHLIINAVGIPLSFP